MKPPDPIFVLIIVVLLIALWWVKRRRPVRIVGELEQALRGSQPVLVEVYTDT